ncbi:MAG: MarR family winged helix-turn-helix transcriptional regulator [Betaproteobacteria bacterium]|nr:MarR family winged helix-turn-helix transcriptional regulator [Betaproteobacteria bacterium]
MSQTPIIPTPIDVLKQFRVIFNTIKRHFQQTETVSRISGAQIWTLSIIARQPGVCVSDLANMMGIHQSTCSNLVNQLCHQKLTSKQRSDNDHRVVCLYPTEDGLRVLNKNPCPLEGLLPNALRQLPDKDLIELHLLLKKLILVLQPRDPAVIESANMPLAETVASVPYYRK